MISSEDQRYNSTSNRLESIKEEFEDDDNHEGNHLVMVTINSAAPKVVKMSA